MTVRLTMQPLEWALIPYRTRSYMRWDGFFLCFWLAITDIAP